LKRLSNEKKLAESLTTARKHFDLSKEIMTIKAELLAVVNRLGYVEKKLMR
jgi:hypothetical protein